MTEIKKEVHEDSSARKLMCFFTLICLSPQIIWNVFLKVLDLSQNLVLFKKIVFPSGMTQLNKTCFYNRSYYVLCHEGGTFFNLKNYKVLAVELFCFESLNNYFWS